MSPNVLLLCCMCIQFSVMFFVHCITCLYYLYYIYIVLHVFGINKSIIKKKSMCFRFASRLLPLDEFERLSHGHGLLIPKDFRAPGPFILCIYLLLPFIICVHVHLMKHTLSEHMMLIKSMKQIMFLFHIFVLCISGR